MLDEQGSVCAICKQPETTKNRKSGDTYALCVDHCHRSSQVRGLLCFTCNHGLGNFKDNPDLLLKAVAYLETSRDRS